MTIRTVCTDRISSSRSVDDPNRLQFTDRLHRLRFVHTDCTNCKTALTDRIRSCLMDSPHCYTINSLDIFFVHFAGDLSSDESCRRLVADVVWQRLKYYFPAAPEFISARSVCRLCQVRYRLSVCLHSFPFFTNSALLPRNVLLVVKATEQYFPVVLFVVLYDVVLTFKSVNEILKESPFK